jgi:hypothetical protein
MGHLFHISMLVYQAGYGLVLPHGMAFFHIKNFSKNASDPIIPLAQKLCSLVGEPTKQSPI